MGDLDALLTEALADARAIVREHYGHDLWEADIDWEQPAQTWIDTSDNGTEICRVTDTKLSHAIGFVHGVALTLGLTARELLDHVPETQSRRLVRSHTYSVVSLVEALPRSRSTSTR